MIGKEQAEEIARQIVLAHPGLVKATLLHTSFFEPEEFIRTHRFILDESGVIDRKAVGPAQWTVVFEVVVRSDERFRKFLVADDKDQNNLFLRFSLAVDVDPESGKGVIVREVGKVIRFCEQSNP